MQHSESIAKISAALSKAQGAMASASKDAKGNYGKYADLASIWDACRAPLADNQIAVIQAPGETADKVITMTTVLAHSSGEWFRETLTIPMQRIDAQGYGSACTYARRYALAAMVGIAPSEDDGTAASAIGGMNNAPRQAANEVGGAKPTFPKGPCTGISNLKVEIRKMKDLGNKAASLEAFEQVAKEYELHRKQLEDLGHEWWTGVDKDGNAFESVPAWLDRRRAELSEPDHLQILLDAMRENHTKQALTIWAANQEIVIDGLPDDKRRLFEAEYDAYEAGLQQVATVAAG